MADERLQKVLAAAGVASRRACESLITAGRVQVDGRVVTELGSKVNPETARITVDGRAVDLRPGHVYYKVHKPREMLSDFGGDARGRKTVAGLLPADAPRVFPVGRLDLNSEGLMLLTDDGELAHQLTHPRYEHPKTYYVLVAERPTEEALDRLRRGIQLGEDQTAPAEVRVVPDLPAGLMLAPGPVHGVWLEIVLREGKKRQVRHMTAAVGYPTLRLVRWAIGPLTLSGLKCGELTQLSRSELSRLRTWVQTPATRRRGPAKRVSRNTPGKRTGTRGRVPSAPVKAPRAGRRKQANRS
jgi:23S rRNA pseudouridine2605 synthase